jgi:hypothetical protein
MPRQGGNKRRDTKGKRRRRRHHHADLAKSSQLKLSPSSEQQAVKFRMGR